LDSSKTTNKNNIPLVTAFFLFFLVVIFAYDYLRLAALVSLVLFVCLVFGYGIIWLIKAWQGLQADIDKRYKNNLFVAPKDSQIVAIERRGREVYHKKVHLVQSAYSNGHYQEPTVTEREAFELFHGKRITSNKQPLLIEGQTTERQKTIFDVVNTGIHFSLIGPTNGGKSTLANHIIDYINANKTYALDPHAKFNIWSDKCLISQKYDDIQYTLEQAFIEMSSRYDKGPGDYDSILLAIDEWPAIIAERPECEQYISRISREGRKVDVRLVLLSQSDQIGEIGLSVALRNNFVKIELVPELTKQNLGTIKHWDKSIETIQLAGPYNGKQLSTEERVIQIWQMADQSNLDEAVKQIVNQVYSSDGGNQRQTVRKIIEKYQKGLSNEVN